MSSVSQEQFRAALLDAQAPMPEGLLDGAGRAAGRRYAVYRNNVAVSLRDALQTGFPAIASLLGEANFAMVARHFLRTNPPGSPLMMHYGAAFPDFLDAAEPLAHLPYLGDVARLELAQRRSYHAADTAPVDASVFQGLEDDALMAAHLVLAPAVEVIRSRWAVMSIYHFALNPEAGKPGAAPEDVLITRPGFDPQMHVLPPGGAAFVTACQTGASFGAALDAAGEDFDLPATLSLLLSGGAISKLKL